MCSRADKQLGRQDAVLVRAIFRVWRARGRGILLENVRILTLLNHFWRRWRRQQGNFNSMQGLSPMSFDCLLCLIFCFLLLVMAARFASRGTSVAVLSAYAAWKTAFLTHQNAQTFAIYHYNSRLCTETFIRWHRHFYQHLKTMKRARIVDKRLVMRRKWLEWRVAYEHRKREKTLRSFELEKLRKIMTGGFFEGLTCSC